MPVTVVSVGNRRLGPAPELPPDVKLVTPADIAGLDTQIAAGLQAEALFVMGSSDPALSRAGALGARWVHVGATGVENLEQDIFEQRVVTCGRGVSGIPIAEFVLASMLAFEKRIPEMWLDAAPDRWASARLGELATKTLGIVGLGGIGAAVARRALAFDMDVLAVRRDPNRAAPPGVEVVPTLDELSARSDHLVLAAPATPETRALLDARTLRLVKPGVHIVNVARGTLIDQDALREALDDERVALASLDVTDPEPLPDGHWMYTHPRIHVSAHVSWSSPEAGARIVRAFSENLQRFVAGEPLHGVVHAEARY